MFLSTLCTFGCRVAAQGGEWPATQDSSGANDSASEDQDTAANDTAETDDDTAETDDDTAETDDDTAETDDEGENQDEDEDEDEDTGVHHNTAIVIESSFPASLECGEEGTASVELLNEGSTTWSREAGYKLGTVADEDPLFDLTRVYLPQDAHIPPGQVWSFEMTLQAPEEEGTYTTDWQMVEEHVEWFGEIAESQVEVVCPPEEAWEYTGDIADSVLSHASHVRNNYPQFFNLEALDGHTKRTIAYEMMTTVINLLRTDGVDASRCIANPGLPESDPFHWCSDALVVGPPGIGVTLDIYWSWSDPATPQTAMTETEATGVVTSDLAPLQ